MVFAPLPHPLPLPSRTYIDSSRRLCASLCFDLFCGFETSIGIAA
uniref:Uncharacterized protein n=1 Tax=Arundo donax TaxID=35708 RepID=A0A0A9GLV7_ARUDO